MSISNSELEHVAKLARISLTESEKKYYTEQLSAVLGYINQLNEVDTKSVVRTIQVTGLSNVLREDVVEPASQEVVSEIRNGFPKKSCDFLQVGEVFSEK